MPPLKYDHTAKFVFVKSEKNTGKGIRKKHTRTIMNIIKHIVLKTKNNMENQQVEKFDPSTLMEGVKSRIKSTFVSLIPDAQWEQMCDSEMKKFFEPQKKNHGSTNYPDWRTTPSQFEEIVTQMMKEHCHAYIKELFAKPEYSVTAIYENNPIGGATQKATLSDHLDKMIKEKMPEMMQAMFSSVMSDAFYTFFNNIQNKIQSPMPRY